MYMKGIKVASTVAYIVPRGLDENELADTTAIDEAMKKTVYLFGLNAAATYRMMELRLWSCERSKDHIKMMMYEYLRAAVTKKKFKVKIRNMRGDDPKAIKPPPVGSLLSPPKESNRGAKGLLHPRRHRANTETSTGSQDEATFAFHASFRAFGSEASKEKDALASSNFEASQLRKEPRLDVLSGAPSECSIQSDSATKVISEDAHYQKSPARPPGENIDTRGLTPEATHEDWSSAVPLSRQSEVVRRRRSSEDHQQRGTLEVTEVDCLALLPVTATPGNGTCKASLYVKSTHDCLN